MWIVEWGQMEAEETSQMTVHLDSYPQTPRSGHAVDSDVGIACTNESAEVVVVLAVVLQQVSKKALSSRG